MHGVGRGGAGVRVGAVRNRLRSGGLIPQEVDVASLRLYNLWSQGASRTAQPTADLLWVNVTDGGVTAFVFHKGALVFLRSKLQGGIGSGGGGRRVRSK